ncbi:MAG: 4Fe-4S dicluster domain-containing protein [Candidatus Magnetominusculus sp. LBB02]|nr:4Fe-4S dicluster domain-containing protein [Candidatus Magnetominusculus sp. LBB02]
MTKSPKWAMIIDTTKCVGCFACVAACHNQNDLELTEHFNRVEEQEFGTFPNFSRRFVPMQCQHCDNPPCVGVCPTGASYKRTDGVVAIDAQRCIGCKYCILSCPYNARTINRAHGYVHKCSFCISLVESGSMPACVSTCPTGVRIFGDINDPGSEVAKLAHSKKTSRIGKDLNTMPSIYYIIE